MIKNKKTENFTITKKHAFERYFFTFDCRSLTDYQNIMRTLKLNE